MKKKKKPAGILVKLAHATTSPEYILIYKTGVAISNFDRSILIFIHKPSLQELTVKSSCQKHSLSNILSLQKNWNEI